jgi:hypothetical protein
VKRNTELEKQIAETVAAVAAGVVAGGTEGEAGLRPIVGRQQAKIAELEKVRTDPGIPAVYCTVT